MATQLIDDKGHAVEALVCKQDSTNEFIAYCGVCGHFVVVKSDLTAVEAAKGSN